MLPLLIGVCQLLAVTSTKLCGSTSCNHGTCTTVNNAQTCVCAPNFWGTDCGSNCNDKDGWCKCDTGSLNGVIWVGDMSTEVCACQCSCAVGDDCKNVNDVCVDGDCIPPPCEVDDDCRGANKICFDGECVTAGGGFQSCDDQSSCIDIEITLVDETTDTHCSDCHYKACLKLSGLDGGSAGCRKSGTISHVCEQDKTCVASAGFPNFDLHYAEVSELSSTYEECQYGKPGQVLYFVLKDGKGCSQGPSGDFEFTHDITTYAHCEPTTSKTCTGKGNIGKECLWSVQLPDAAATPCTNCSPNVETTLLIAGQSGNVGAVSVMYSDASLVISYATKDDWLIKEYHVEVELRDTLNNPPHELLDVLTYPAGSPKNGRFYKTNSAVGYLPSVVVVYNASDLADYVNASCDAPGAGVYELVIAAHAVVSKGSGDLAPTETAWGYGQKMDNQWAMKFYYQLDCTCEAPLCDGTAAWTNMIDGDCPVPCGPGFMPQIRTLDSKECYTPLEASIQFSDCSSAACEETCKSEDKTISLKSGSTKYATLEAKWDGDVLKSIFMTSVTNSKFQEVVLFAKGGPVGTLVDGSGQPLSNVLPTGFTSAASTDFGDLKYVVRQQSLDAKNQAFYRWKELLTTLCAGNTDVDAKFEVLVAGRAIVKPQKGALVTVVTSGTPISFTTRCFCAMATPFAAPSQATDSQCPAPESNGWVWGIVGAAIGATVTAVGAAVAFLIHQRSAKGKAEALFVIDEVDSNRIDPSVTPLMQSQHLSAPAHVSSPFTSPAAKRGILS